MTKVTLTDLGSLTGLSGGVVTTINTNNDLIEQAIDNTISRDGTSPNQMEADFDLNDNDILNAGTLNANSINVQSLFIGGLEAVPTVVGGVPVFATRSAALAYSTNIAPSYIRTEGYSIAGDGGGGCYVLVGSQPTHQGKISITVNGTPTWYALTETIVSLEMFGGIANGTLVGSVTSGTDNSTAMDAALGFITANVNSVYSAGPYIKGKFGAYYFSRTIILTKNVRIEGAAGAGQGNASLGTQYIFPINTIGILGLSSTSINPSTGLASGFDASGATVRYLQLLSAGGTDTTKHGIAMRCRMLVEDCLINGFSGNAIDVRSNDTIGGNINNWEVRGGRLTNCLNGIATAGADSNAGTALHVDCSSNLQSGVLDRSFLGNTYLGCHMNGNGKLGQVSDGVNRYRAVPSVARLDDPSLLSTTVPGTNATIWELVGAGAVNSSYPLWVNGGSYLVPGQRISTNSNARTLFAGGYTEPGWPADFMITPATGFGGTISAGYHANSTAGIYLSNVWTNVISFGGKLLAIVNAVTGVGELAYLHNSGSTTTNRGARQAFYAGFKTDGTTKRPAGGVYGRALSSTQTVNTAVGLEYFDATGDVLAKAVEFSGNVLEGAPGVDNVWKFGTTALRWLSGTFVKVFVGAGATFWTSGTGTPEGVVVGPIGSLYTRTDGGAGTTLYVKETGAGNTGWIGK